MSLAICEPYPAENKVKVLYSQKAGVTTCRRAQVAVEGRKMMPPNKNRLTIAVGAAVENANPLRVKDVANHVGGRRRKVGTRAKAHELTSDPGDASSSRSQKSRSGRNSQGGRKRSSGAKGRRAVGPNKTPSAKRRSHFAEEANKAIPALVTMISGCHDAQTSADVANLSSQFKLPNPAGKSGGACTAALLEVLHCSSSDDEREMSWVDVLRRMRIVLNKKGFDQCPQLTCSRMINVKDRFFITPPDFNEVNNTKRAVGFRDENVTMLLDDNKHRSPTKAAILSAYKKTRYAR
ncbi:hypothetical protein THAOC_19040, partial [Thalassiosira oceanica]